VLEWVGLVFLAVGAGGALFSALSVGERFLAARVLPSFSSISLLFLFAAAALVGAFTYSYAETSSSFTQASVTFASPSPLPSPSALEYKVLESKTEVFTKQVSPVECEGISNLVYWRELQMYNSTLVDEHGKNKTVSFSTFTLTIRNKGNASVSNVLVTEHVPDIVAAEPGQIFNYSSAPLSVRKGSVVVEWLFDKIDAGGEKTVSYTVEKRVDADSLKDFEAPNVVAQAVKAGAAAGSVSPTPVVTVAAQRAGGDWTLPGIVVAMALVAAVVYFFTRKIRQIA